MAKGKDGKNYKLTEKQEKFAKLVAIEGLTQSDAYRQAYSCERMTDKTIWEAAARLAADRKVCARIEQLKAKIEEKCIWTKEEMLRDLWAIKDEMMAKKENGGLSHNERNTAIKAIERAAKMLGYDAPEKVEIGQEKPFEVKIEVISNESKDNS